MTYQGSLPSGQLYHGQSQYQYPQTQNQQPQYAYTSQAQPQPQAQPQLLPHQQYQQQYQQAQSQQQFQYQEPNRHANYAPAAAPVPANLMNASAGGHFPTFENTYAASPQFQPSPPIPHSHIPSPNPNAAQFPSQFYHSPRQAPQHLQQVQQHHHNNAYPPYQQQAPSPQPQQYYQQPNPSAMGQNQSVQIPGQPTSSQQGYIQQRVTHPNAEPQRPHQPQGYYNSPVQPVAQSPAVAKQSPAISITQSPTVSVKQSPQVTAKRSPAVSVKKSPAVSAKASPAASTRPSPAVSSKAPPFDTSAVLVHIAEECLDKARAALPAVSTSLGQPQVREYQKLVSTGLACLDAAIHSNKLSPRQEAKARLRYASILSEETENLQEAETTLFQGIKLCEKHRYADLKYCMQYVSLKVLFQRNHKAAFIAIEKQISECQTFKHYPWIYAFRLLKATLHSYAGSAPDAALIDNLQALSSLAHQRGDHALGVLASLLEGLAHLRVVRADTLEKVQTCLAQASKYQMEPSVQIPQIDVLSLLLDLSCSMHQKNPDMLIQKLSTLHSKLDGTLSSHAWPDSMTDICIPIGKQHSSSSIVSEDTAAILRPGEAGGTVDFVVLSFLTKVEAFLLAYTFSGLASMYRPGSNLPQGHKKSSEFWEEGLGIVHRWAECMTGDNAVVSASLQESIRQNKWRTETFCYLQLLMGLYSAMQSKWSTVDSCVAKLQKAASPDVNDIFGLFALYLAGVYHQGTGDLETALLLYEDPRLALEPGVAGVGSRKPAKLEICILAGLNRLWILQEPSYYDATTSTALLELLRPLCIEHPDLEIRTAFHLVQSTIQTDPPPSMAVVKESIQTAVQISRKTSNVHCLSIALNVMRCRLFENVVGEQAMKSAKAGAAQARRSGNLLWMSVADGMLAQSHEFQGQVKEAETTRAVAAENASIAFTGRT